jgi:electron transport complex protein RnfB
MTMDSEPESPGRRNFLLMLARGAALAGLAGGTGWLLWKREGITSEERTGTRWQIDPYKCEQCGRCATECVMTPSAVKCVHAFDLCGYCDRCLGFLKPEVKEPSAGAELELCPAGAIKRVFIEHPYYEYPIDEKLCIGCGKCVKGCLKYGNGSLFLQINHRLCKNCNECQIAQRCPAKAIRRVPASSPYLLKTKAHA